MALVKGTNSYVTVEEADAYFADRLDAAAWTAADATQKAQALVTATAYLDELRWTGTAVSESQSLAFPRVTEYFDPRLGTSIYLEGNTVPSRITKACTELAYHLLNNDGLLDETGGVRDISIGPITLTGISNAPKIPSNIKRLITPLVVNSGSNPWWRAN
jgi:hypothetical protein